MPALAGRPAPAALKPRTPFPRSLDADRASHSPSCQAYAPAIALLGVPFEPVTLAAAVDRIQAMIASGRPHYVVTPNVDFLVQARRDDELRRILIEAHLVVCDGTPLRWASRWLGNALPERVAGSDLVPELIRLAAERGQRIFLLGATEEANAQAVSNLTQRFPQLRIAGHYSPPFRPWQPADQQEIEERIRAARPDLLFVAFGCPKAEKWIAANHERLGVPVTIGVGATIDFLAGRVRRAPRWMRTAGLEWSFRLAQEPRRLFRRYASDFWYFSLALTAQWWQTRSPRWTHARDVHRPAVVWGQQWERIQLPSCFDAVTVRQAGPIWAGLKGRHCFLDLNSVRFIDSTGVGLLLSLRNQLTAAGRRLVLLSPSPSVARVLQLMRVQDLFLTARDTGEALRSLEMEGMNPPNLTAPSARPTVSRDSIRQPARRLSPGSLARQSEFSSAP
jgi:N-acetylglucosaminyldiphosphoundecaprenol N-acetyl-beta-D-mannosaminyltransferase